MVFIRTDANEKIATGHVMRCMTIGKKLEELGEKVCFLLKEADSQKVLDGQMRYQMLDTCEDSIYAEIPQIIELLKTKKHPKLLLDSYEFDGTYMRQLKKYAVLITFDDMFQEKFPADIIINYNLYAEKYDYAARYTGEDVTLLLGSAYVPLRKEFEREEILLRENVKTVMFICGGGDKYHILLELLEKFCIRQLQKKYQVLVIAGALNMDKEKIKRLAKQQKNITVYENVKEIAPIMEQADVVVSAASTVLYECCCMMRPVIFFTMADNQKEDAAAFGAEGMMHYVGDIRENMGQVVEDILEEIEIIAQDVKIRKFMIDKMAQVVDGKGAERIAQVIVDAVSN